MHHGDRGPLHQEVHQVLTTTEQHIITFCRHHQPIELLQTPIDLLQRHLGKAARQHKHPELNV
jgi:hypothetical protein